VSSGFALACRVALREVAGALAIVASLVCFAALHAGAPFGYADWLGMFALAALGNLIGGLTLVTVLRLL
jgi:hypothetical protein